MLPLVAARHRRVTSFSAHRNKAKRWTASRWQKLGCCGDKPSQRLGVDRFVDAGLHFSGLTGWARSSTLERLDAFLFIDAGELILLKLVWCLNALWSLITVGDLECSSLNENLSLCSSLLILCVLTCGYGYLWGFVSLYGPKSLWGFVSSLLVLLWCTAVPGNFDFMWCYWFYVVLLDFSRSIF